MENYIKNWTKKELRTYLMLFCMNADWMNRNKNNHLLKLDICKNNLNDLCGEFENDNDYQGIQKIDTALKMNYRSKEQRVSFFQEMKDHFLLAGLERILINT